MKLKISVHKSCKNKANPQKVARGWSNIYEDITWLLGWVQHGYGWTATHFIDKHRKAENACGSNLVVIDFDGDTTLEDFWLLRQLKIGALQLTLRQVTQLSSIGSVLYFH